MTTTCRWWCALPMIRARAHFFVATSKRNLLHGSRRAPAKNGSTSRVMCSSFHTTAVGERPLWTTSIPRRHRSSCNRRPVGASMPIASRRTFHQQPSGSSLAAMERFGSHLAKMEGFIRLLGTARRSVVGGRSAFRHCATMMKQARSSSILSPAMPFPPSVTLISSAVAFAAGALIEMGIRR